MPEKLKRWYMGSDTWISLISNLMTPEAVERRANNVKAMRIPNTEGSRPKTFEIDCVIGQEALEVKWRDATTEGDHIMKEHTRVRTISKVGYAPIRVMFYYPNRGQAMKIQQTIESIYHGLHGQYYHSDEARGYIKTKTGVDLKGILEMLAKERGNTSNESCCVSWRLPRHFKDAS